MNEDTCARLCICSDGAPGSPGAHQLRPGLLTPVQWVGFLPTSRTGLLWKPGVLSVSRRCAQPLYSCRWAVWSLPGPFGAGGWLAENVAGSLVQHRLCIFRAVLLVPTLELLPKPLQSPSEPTCLSNTGILRTGVPFLSKEDLMFCILVFFFLFF